MTAEVLRRDGSRDGRDLSTFAEKKSQTLAFFWFQAGLLAVVALATSIAKGNIGKVPSSLVMSGRGKTGTSTFLVGLCGPGPWLSVF